MENGNKLPVNASIVIVILALVGGFFLIRWAKNAPPPPMEESAISKTIESGDHLLGNKEAKVLLIEYSDLECPYCKDFHPTLERIVNESQGEIAWVYRHFPILTRHPKAQKEAEASECAAEFLGNEGFWKYIGRIFEITPSNNGLDPQKLTETAVELGISEKNFTDCLNSGKYEKTVKDNYQKGLDDGAQGTPHTLILGADGTKSSIGGITLYNNAKAVIDKVLLKQR